MESKTKKVILDDDEEEEQKIKKIKANQLDDVLKLESILANQLPKMNQKESMTTKQENTISNKIYEKKRIEVKRPILNNKEKEKIYIRKENINNQSSNLQRKRVLEESDDEDLSEKQRQKQKEKDIVNVKAKSKPKGEDKIKDKQGESSNDSVYDSESYETYTEESDSKCSNDSSSEQSKPKKKIINNLKDIKPKTKPREIISSNNKKNQISLKTKETLVYALLKRWWYAIDIEWYKSDKKIEDLLLDNKLRKVEVSNWKIEDNEVNGMKKCIELKGFPYVFLDYNEKFYDLRKKENCPSFVNLMKKEKKELIELNIKAITKQLFELDNSKSCYVSDISLLRSELNKELESFRKELGKN